MDYEAVAEVICYSSCDECRACFPELAKYCDEHEELVGVYCDKLIARYLKERTKNL